MWDLMFYFLIIAFLLNTVAILIERILLADLIPLDEHMNYCNEFFRITTQITWHDFS